MPRSFLFFSLLFLLSQCGPPPKEFASFDRAAFAADRNGCQGVRQARQAELERIRRDLRGLSQDQILAVLGKPDRQRLGKRNGKQYIYFLAPGSQCDPTASPARTLVLYYSALEIVTEASYATGLPD